MASSEFESFDMDGEVFIKGNVAVNRTGIAMRDNPKTFTVVYEELELCEEIGRGCSSWVMRALHKPSGTPLALKVINILDKSKRDQLLREISALYNAQCPCLVKFYGAFYRENAITIALEYMDGGALTTVLSSLKRLPEEVLANVTFQILWALAYLKHEKRVHRDIKPSNILINSDGEIKVSDFGISAELQSSLAMCATFVGTFNYMSPERIQSKPYSYSSDIWSLGLVLIECATGQYPYPVGNSCIEMVQTLLEYPTPTLNPEVFSPEFCSFIASCVQKDPSARLPADVLLGSPWLIKNGALSLVAAISNVEKWIQSLS